MARSMNTDEPVYRVLITKRVYGPNPNYRVTYDANGRCEANGDRWTYSETETHTISYGPYEELGPAKAMLTKESRNWKGEPDPAFVGGTVQEGRIHWEDMP